MKKIYLGIAALAILLMAAFLVQGSFDSGDNDQAPEESGDTDQAFEDSSKDSVSQPSECAPQTCNYQCGGTCGVSSCGCS